MRDCPDPRRVVGNPGAWGAGNPWRLIPALSNERTEEKGIRENDIWNNYKFWFMGMLPFFESSSFYFIFYCSLIKVSFLSWLFTSFPSILPSSLSLRFLLCLCALHCGRGAGGGRESGMNDFMIIRTERDSEIPGDIIINLDGVKTEKEETPLNPIHQKMILSLFLYVSILLLSFLIPNTLTFTFHFFETVNLLKPFFFFISANKSRFSPKKK